MSTVDVEALNPVQRARYEEKRAREFYRYFEPIKALTGTGPVWTDLNNPAAVAVHHPVSSPDKALTAFCQLAALKTGARRAMLFFFDTSYAYVLAEATRTLSLIDDNLHDVDDSLWLGHTVIPRGFSVCEHTVNIPAANRGSNSFDPTAGIVHIINDLREDTRFCSRPYVTDEPNARFYAGVPITTPRGFNIGAFCVLDDKVRQGLGEKTIDFLVEMSSTVMNHLEMVRMRAEYERGMQMVKGLESFIEGAASQRKKVSPSSLEDVVEEISTPVVPADNAPQPGLSPKPRHSLIQAHSNETIALAHTPGEPHRDAQDNDERRSSTDTNSAMQEEGQRTTARRSMKGVDIQEQLVTQKVKSTFQRAARVIQNAIAVDGVMFLNASVNTFGGLVRGSDSGESSDHLGTSTDATATEEEQSPHNRSGSDGGGSVHEPKDRPCPVLGAQYSDASNKGHAQISERLMHQLLRKYKRGHIWTFDSDDGEETSSSDDPILRRYSQSNDEGREHSGVTSNGALAKSGRKGRRKARSCDKKQLQKLFPNARSVALIGLWDQARDKWYAGGLVWTRSPMRIFSEDGEMHYLTAFCDVIMAEVNRIDAQSADQAKSDFISSISHELRSPLHGILGSAEILQEHASDRTISSMATQIETCGRTLLDIIDHLLDFSKINHFAKHTSVRGAGSGDSGSRRLAFAASRKTRLSGIMSLQAEVPFDKVTEEVVEAAVYSHCLSRDRQTLLNRKVTVALDIDKTPGFDWNCRIALGAWKRVCINLVSNALKYTSEGYVLVSLKSVFSAGRRKRRGAILTVTDSGIGMSKQFLENRLFHAFTQENQLAEGTGLGMSLVAKIMKRLNGKVEVQSEKGVGTTVSVMLPLEGGHSRRTTLLPEIAYQPRFNITIGFLGSTPPASQDATTAGLDLLSTTLLKTARDLGATIAPPTWSISNTTDMNMITEQDLAALLQFVQGHDHDKDNETRPHKETVMYKPLIVICDNIVSARALRQLHIGGIIGSHVELLMQPCGPERLRSAVEACRDETKPGAARRASYSLVEKERLSAQDEPTVLSAQSPLSDSTPTSGYRPRQLRPTLPAHSRTAFPQVLQPERSFLTPSALSQTQSPAIALEASSPDGVPKSPLEFPFPFTVPQEGERLPPTPLTPALPHRQKKKPPSAMCQKLSLLLVDDNRINLQLLITYADKYGHRKSTSSNGLEAVEAYKAGAEESQMDQQISPAVSPASDSSSRVTAPPPPARPQVILMDINMPVMDGFEATRRIRTFEKERNLAPATIIALTGLGSAEAQQEAYCSGVDLFLTKPVRLKELTKVLAEVADKAYGENGDV